VGKVFNIFSIEKNMTESTSAVTEDSEEIPDQHGADLIVGIVLDMFAAVQEELDHISEAIKEHEAKIAHLEDIIVALKRS
jgi:hypothetical protein